MNYALLKDSVVINIIWLHPMNAHEFSNAIPMNDLQVAIGDTYVDGKFYHDGVEVTNIMHVEQSVVDDIMQEVSSYGY